MKRTKFLAVLMTIVSVFCVCVAGGSVLLLTVPQIAQAQQTDNDMAGLWEGLEIDPNNIGGILGGLMGSAESTTAANDDQMSTVTTIVQALLGGTQEGESTLDAIKNKLGDLGGTVSENELIQAIVSTLLGFDFSNFDMSMLTSNEFITALMGTLGGMSIGGAQQMTPTPSQQPSTQSVVITTIPTVSTTGTPIAGQMTPSQNNQGVPGVSNQTVPGVNTQTVPTVNNQTVPTTLPYNTQDTTAYIPSGNVGVIVDNTANSTTPIVPSASMAVPTAPEVTQGTQQQMPDGTQSMVSGKMIVGIIVLLLSGISVVAVVLVLRKNKG